MKYKPYFHRFRKEDQEKILENNRQIKIKCFLNKYCQPEWCNYPDALAGVLGCWSLMGCVIHKVEDCNNCDLVKEKYRGSGWRDPWENIRNAKEGKNVTKGCKTNHKRKDIITKDF